MRKFVWLIPIIFTLYTSCKTSQLQPSSDTTTEEILFSVQGNGVTAGEFNYVFNKNNSFRNYQVTDSAIDAYLNLYINFKLKVQEAKDQEIDKEPKFQQEFESYRKEISKPFLLQNQATEELVKQAYERMKEEINASHILITLAQDATPEDTLKAYQKISDIRARALKGESFDRLALEFSQDPSAQQNKGNLGWFSALQMVYSFEEASYNTPAGAISEIVRTRFGYHLINVNDKRSAQGKVKVSHIMLRHKINKSADDSVAVRNRIFQIYRELEEGADWFQLCTQYSEDLNTKATGGTLQWFSTGQLVPEFENAAFALKNQGDISKPIRTTYGWHIIKLEDKRGVDSFDEMKSSITMRVQRDGRSAMQQDKIIEKLKQENNFEANEPLIAQLKALADSSILAANTWALPAISFKKNDKNYLFSINNRHYQLADLKHYINNNPRTFNNLNPAEVLNNYINEFIKKSLFDYEEANLESKHPDYKYLANEYREGLLLFEIMEKEVWKKAVDDKEGQQAFFENNRDKYQWDKRADGYIFNLKNQADLPIIQGIIRDTLFPVSRIKIAITDTSGLRFIVKQLKQNKQHYLRIHKNDQSKVNSFFIKEGIDNKRIILSDKKEPILLSSSIFELEKYFNSKDPLNLSIIKGPFEKNHPSLPNEYNWKIGEQLIKHDDYLQLILVNAILPKGHKSFEEARGIVISDYQDYLEKEWIDSLKAKYHIEINQQTLQKILNENS